MIRRFLILAAALLSLCGAKADIIADFYASADSVRARIADEIAATPADSLAAVMERAEETFFEPTSPQYCEGVFALYLEAAIPLISDETEREIAEWKLRDVCLLNGEGATAADFRFDLAKGPRKVSLSRYLKGKPLAVIFYDPDCRHCQQTIAELSSLAERVNVLAVCIESTEARWEQTRGALPEGWAAAFDRSNIPETDLYSIRSLPSVYLLDPDHKVIMKNPTPTRLLDYLDKK